MDHLSWFLFSLSLLKVCRIPVLETRTGTWKVLRDWVSFS